MKLPKIILFAVTLMGALQLMAQPQEPWSQRLQQLYDDETRASADFQLAYDHLCHLEQQPLNLNTVTREELSLLPFLSEKQIDGILEYRHHNGPFLSTSELRAIAALDYPQIALLKCFTTVIPVKEEPSFPSLRQLQHGGRHQLTATISIPFYRRQGDKSGYIGDPCRHDLRYQYAYSDMVRWGIIGAKDAGEPFFADRNKQGYDHYACYLQIRRFHKIRNAVIGCYQLSAGMGLILNSGFSLGKLGSLQQMNRTGVSLLPHASRTVSGYFQGAATTIALSRTLTATPFFSYRSHDATLNEDGSIRTLVNSGYHRTSAEMEKKNNSQAAAAGICFNCHHQHLQVGLTALYTSFNRRLQPQDNILYRRHDPQGSHFFNVGITYSYHHPRITLRGETAVNEKAALATINSLGLQAADRMQILLLHRFYSYRYTALYARSLSEGGRVQNEQGILAGITWSPSPRWQFNTYIDYACFPWARYQVSASSHAWDGLLSAAYQQSRWRLTGRYRWRRRQHDNPTKTGLNQVNEHRGRLSWLYQVGGQSNLSAQVDAVSTDNNDWGYMLSGTSHLQWKKVKLHMGMGYFHTNSYNSRLYVYENGPLYTYSLPMYSGEGLRCYAMIQSSLSRKLKVTGKIGYSYFFDRSTSNSGLESVSSASRPSLQLQLRYEL